ncbi:MULTISPECIES: hypothetical protein [Halorussus]|uniref:hypothetical protein n=1 Tax=Halorussus TaxID=1070314 RepID=UPI00209E62D7|nr:hypothetical protein [Halorussus vallis]USZ74847.1 hypothetical protein NGM07_15565 [Halorussus vallis]
MGIFEEIAVLDLKFRVVVALVLTFVGVSFPMALLLESKVGFAVGAAAAVVVASLTARKLR